MPPIVIDPQGAGTGWYRVIRGGGWFYHGKHCRSSLRFKSDHEPCSQDVGFRVIAPIEGGDMLVVPRGAKSGSGRVFRGGDWSYWPDGCRSAYRWGGGQRTGSSRCGFRIISTQGIPMQTLSLEDGILSSMHEDPSDISPWLALTDHLDESGDQRADFARLQVLASGIETGDDYTEVQTRVRKLLLSGIRPPVPTVTNSIGMELVLIPPGIFMMGSPDDEKGRSSDEGPQRLVCISKPFYMGKYPVTQMEWHAVMGNNPSHFRGDRLPVECVSWNDCQAFCKKLTEMEGVPYSLPTEAQWEYACRAGATTAFAWGDSLSSHLANFDGNYPYGGAEKGPYLARTSEVGSYIPNAWGLYDMHGNVLEWCQDRYGPYEQPKDDGDNYLTTRGGDWFYGGMHCRSAYTESTRGMSWSTCGIRVTRPVDESLIRDGGSCRVIRGGGWGNYGWGCRSAHRSRIDPWSWSQYDGFRVVVDPIGKGNSIWQSLRGGSWLSMAQQSTSAKRDKGCRFNQYEFRGFRIAV